MPPRQPLPSSARAHVPLLQSIGKTVTTVKRRNELLEDIDDEDERPREEAALKAAETRMGAAIQKVIDCPKTERKPLLVLDDEQRLALRDIYSKTEAYRKGKRHDNIGLEVEAMSEAIEYAFRREEKEPLGKDYTKI